MGVPASARARHGRRRAGLAAAIGAVVFAALAWTLWTVASPAAEVPERVDVVAVHAGAPAERLATGIVLAEAGVTDVLVVAVGSDGVLGHPQLEALCGRREPYRVKCVRAEPVSTIGEARAFGKVFAAHGAERVAVVTSRFHLARASAVVRQCTDAEVVPVAADDRRRLGRVPGEWLRYLASITMRRAC